MTRKYNDIIYLPHHVSKTRLPMAIIDRAAQFSPFAALTGHDAAIKETARLTHKRVELDEYMKIDLNNRLKIIADKIKEDHEISITYFQPDEKKEGGVYITATNRVKKIDKYEGLIFMVDGREIPMDQILSIDGQIFDE
ncbi:MAG: YolD-like family protein [Tissierella sp.]|nr:YolD-like family protein [Tissierella sp.]